MEMYVGTKVIEGKPMTRQVYCDVRGWNVPDDENGADEGHLVHYIGAGRPNLDEYSDYVSWSPDDVFDGAYKRSGELSFGAAIELLQLGYKMSRSGWNGKGMWLIYIPGSKNITFTSETPYAKALAEKADEHGNVTSQEILPHIDMYTINADGRRAMLPGWLASQSDMLAKDWCIVE